MNTIVPDSLTTGLQTVWMDSASAMDPLVPLLRVSWIKWDSAFRGTDLAIGDRIVAINSGAFSWLAPATPPGRLISRLPGQYDEAQTWKEAGAQEGQPVSLRVRRRKTPGHGWSELEVLGELRSSCVYTDANNNRLIGPGGPPEMESDGFNSSWSSWLEQVATPWKLILDEGPWLAPEVTDPAITQHLQNQDRVALLRQKYPGPFADAIGADYENVSRRLAGHTYALTPGELDYRELGEKRRRQIADVGTAAREAFLQTHAAELIPAFPSIDPILGKRQSVVGKLVELHTVTSREWIAQGPRTWFVFSDGTGWYFAEGEGEAMQRALIAERRYEESVSPNVREEYAVIGRILPEPALVVIDEQGHFGLKVEPAAMSFGDAFFIDLLSNSRTTGSDSSAPPKEQASPSAEWRPAAGPCALSGQTLFSGEEQIAAVKFPPPADDATPEAVMASLFGALKLGDEKMWGSLYADWTVYIADNGLPIINPGIPPSLESPWTDARREILDRVADVRVVWSGDSHDIVAGKEFEGAPRIEETMVEVEHLRLHDDSLQTFFATGFTNYWTLQRMNGGPWRITNNGGI